VTGLPECWLGCGYDLTLVVFVGWLWEVDLLCSYPGWDWRAPWKVLPYGGASPDR